MKRLFLHIVAVNLLYGILFITTGHAMNPDAEKDQTVRVKLNARIENYKNEAYKCAETWEKKRVGLDYPEQVTVGMYSGIQHVREASYGHPVALVGGPGVYLKGDCSGCSTLDKAVKAMQRDKVVYEARDFQ